MYHLIKFNLDTTLDFEVSAKQPLERVRLRKDTYVHAQVRPYVVESDWGPVEVADLFLEDGSATRAVPFACFAFVEGEADE